MTRQGCTTGLWIEPRRGTRNGMARLTPARVRHLRREHDAGRPIAHLAREYGVSRAAASYAARRITWRHLT